MIRRLTDINTKYVKEEHGTAFFDSYSIYYKKFTPKPTRLKQSIRYLLRRKRRTLVFIHPFVLNMDVWKYQVDEFKNRHNILLLDLPGFGSSPLNLNTELIPREITKSVAEVIETHTTGRVVLIGNSLGGAFSLSLVEFLKSKIEGFFLLAPLTVEGANMGVFKRLGQWLSTTAATRAVANMANSILPIKLIVQFVFRFSIESSLTVLEKEGFKEYLATYYQRKESIHALISTSKHLNKWDYLDVLYPLIKVPVLIIWGENDKILPISSGKILEEKIASAKLKIIKDMAHHPQLERPVKINKFLKKFIA